MSEYKTNTSLHLSDKADSVFIDKEGTVWENDPNIITVQDALETIQEQSINLIKATDSKYGVVKIAKESDLEKYKGTGDVVTSKQMFDYNSKPEATYTTIGTTQYATKAEIDAGKATNRSVNPKELQVKFDTHNAKTDRFGTIKLSHESMVIPGTDNTTAMTPKLVKLAIDRLVPEVAIATEQNTGTVTLADINTAWEGKVRIGYAISPWAFNKAIAKQDKVGTVQMASVDQAYDANLKDKYVINPYVFQNAKAKTDKRGTVLIAGNNDLKDNKGTEAVPTTKQLLDFYNNSGRATYTKYGTTSYATLAEINTGSLTNKSTTAKDVNNFFYQNNAKTDKYGTIKLATADMVLKATDNTTAVTPNLVKYAIDNHVPKIPTSTETVVGISRLSTVAENESGTIRSGVAVSPYSFSKTNAKQTSFGTVKLASVDDAYKGTLHNGYAISPKIFKDAKASTTNRGTVQLATEAEVKAKSNNDKAVTPLSLKYYSDLIEKLTKQVTDLEKKVKEINDYNVTPIGMLGLFTKNSAPKGWLLADGRSFNSSEYPELYKYLGSNVIPDYTGYFLRGYDPNNRRDPNGSSRSIGSHQGDAIRNIVGSMYMHERRGIDAWGAMYVSSKPYNGSTHHKGGGGSSPTITFDASRVVPTSSENRPVNKTVAIYIRAKNY